MKGRNSKFSLSVSGYAKRALYCLGLLIAAAILPDAAAAESVSVTPQASAGDIGKGNAVEVSFPISRERRTDAGTHQMVPASATGTLESSRSSIDGYSLEAWVEDSLYRVHRYQEAQSVGVNRTVLSLSAAKNDYENGQAVLYSDSAFTITSVTFTNLVGTSSPTNTILSENIKHYFVQYEDLTPPSRPLVNWGVNPDHIYPSSIVPDPFSNATSMYVPANHAQPIFVNIYVPKTAAGDTYVGTMTVNTTAGQKTFSISIKVHDVVIPDTEDSTFLQYIWTETNSFGIEGDRADLGKNYYGLTKYTGDWWQMIGNFAETMVEHRQNMATVWTVNLLKDGGTTINSNGTITWNWSKFDKFIETHRDKGITKFAGGHLANHWAGVLGSVNEGSHVVRLARNARGETILAGGLIPTSIADESRSAEKREVGKWFDLFLPALKSHLESKGWFNDWYQHIFDEPGNINYWRYLQAKLVAKAPGMKYLDAANSTIFQQVHDRVSIWVPLVQTYHNYKSFYTGQKAQGDQIFLYMVGVPTPPGLNRMLDNHLITNDLTYWYSFKEDLDGYLNWALNLWSYGNVTDGGSQITYPDRKNKGLRSSLRHEATRDGLENWELLQIVKRRNPSLAQDLADRVISNYYTYTRDLQYYREIRELLLLVASNASAIDLPDQPSFDVRWAEPDGNGIRYNDDESVVYSSGWIDSPDTSKFTKLNGDVHYTSGSGKYFDITFTGTGIDLISENFRTFGDLEIQIDGVTDTIVSMRGANGKEPQKIVYSKRGLSNSQHRLRGVKRSGGPVLLDGYIVYPAPANQACYFEGADWTGFRTCAGVYSSSFGTTHNNKVSAVAVGSGVHTILYENSGYTGSSVCVDSSTNQSQLGVLNDAASSFKILAGSCPAAPANPAPANQACYFEHADWTGFRACSNVSTSSFGAFHNNKVSAVSVGSGVRTILYENSDYTGSSVCVDSSTNQSQLGVLNDAASSFKVLAGSCPAAPANPAPANQACYFEHADWAGFRVCVGVWRSSFGATHNNTISAVSVGSGVHTILYENSDYTGSSVCVDSSTNQSRLGVLNDTLVLLQGCCGEVSQGAAGC